MNWRNNAVNGKEFPFRPGRCSTCWRGIGKPSHLRHLTGLRLAEGCEWRSPAPFDWASKTARLGQPEVKLGIIPGYGGSQRLAAAFAGKGVAHGFA